MRYLIHLSLSLLIWLSTAHAAGAQELQILDAWIREAPPNAMALAGYLTLTNPGAKERRLVGVTSPDFEWIELHRTVHEGGVAKMQAQDAMPIPAGGRLELRPGDYHLMMMRPARALRAGDEVTADLAFANGERLPVRFVVKKGPGGGYEHHHHH